MQKVVVCVLAAALSSWAVSAQAAEQPADDGRLETARTMIWIGDAGWATLSVLALVGEARGHDETWLRIGLTAGVGAAVTGILGRRLKRRVEGERQNVVSISLPPSGSGKGVAGVWAMRW